MAKGDVLPSEKREFTQPETGVRVIQLTDAPARNTNAYYNDEQFTADGDLYVFRSDRTGNRQLFSVEIESGRIVQLTDAPGDGVGGWSVHPETRRVFFGDGRGNIACLHLDDLREEIVAEPLEGCAGLSGLDLSTCGRFAAISTRSTEARIQRYGGAGYHFKHGTETMALVCDFAKGTRAIVYAGPTAEVPVAPDSHLMLSRDDPSFLWWGSYSGIRPTGFKTAWALRFDPETLMPLSDPERLFDQRPWEFINHYYPAADCHVQMPLYQYSDVHAGGVPEAQTRPGNVSRGGLYIPYLFDVDLRTRRHRRWAFPGQSPLHFQVSSVASEWGGRMWVGDCADPGFLWFAGRGLDERRAAEADPEDCPAIPGDHSHHWMESGAWIGVFRTAGPYVEVRPLARHDTKWKHVHPHPVFSPDGRWVAWGSGDAEQSQVFIAEAVWPRWFA